MIIIEWLKKELGSNGLWPHEAAAVVAAVVEEDANRPHPVMAGRWDDQESDYPRPMMAVLTMSTHRQALIWINANKPRHWARPMFLSQPEREKLFAGAGIVTGTPPGGSPDAATAGKADA